MLLTERTQAFVELGKLWQQMRLGSVSFADPATVTDSAILEEVRNLLESEAGRITRVFDLTLDPDSSTFSGKAEQKLNLAKSQFYQFTMSPNAWDYKLIPVQTVAPEMAEFDEANDADWLGAIEFAVSKSAKAGKRLNCKPGNMQCGGKCQNGKLNCRYKPTPAQAQGVEAIAVKAKATTGSESARVAKVESTVSDKAEESPRKPEGGHEDIPKTVRLSLTAQKQPDGTFKFTATSSSLGERKETEISQKTFKTNIDKYFDGNVKAARRGKVFGVEAQIETMAKNAGITTDQAQAAKDSIIEFTGTSYKEIRSVQRGLATDLDQDSINTFNDHIENINRYIENAPPFSGEVYRGMNFSSTQDRNAFLKSIDDGFSLEAISSSSSDREIARLFATGEGALKDNPPKGHGVLFKIKNKSGVSIQNISDYPQEAEVLIPKGAKYSVRSVNRKGKIIEVELDES
ncbi:hypothetical protein HY772_05580 [Candidatus Woesearchaeota archaeon]|nr:hypothetical protein [Candidatus Woesearchaeota archaeon]